jgi:sec-independent protein translocase protein TatA
MEGFGIEKILLILVVVLLLFGAKRIPEIAGSFGKGIREFKRQMSDIGDADVPAQLTPPRQGAAMERSASPAEDESRAPKRLI